MENTTTATTKKVNNYMPYDIAFIITSKLPPKSVNRFGCLCKSWDLNFENPHFMTIFRKNFISNHRSRHADTSLLLPITSKDPPCVTQLYSLLGEKFENKHKLEWPNLFPDDNNFDILTSYSVNGILCLQRAYEQNVFWNPTTKEFKVIPRSPYTHRECPLVYFHGFGFDNVRNDYKLIRNWDSSLVPPSFEPYWEVYSLRSNSWKKLDGLEPPSSIQDVFSDRTLLYTEGMCHWSGYSRDKTKYKKGSMILSSFDLVNEVFIATPLPDMGDGDIRVWTCLILLNGSIALISYPFDGPLTFHISVLGELGVKESWTKLFIVGPLPYTADPIGVGKNGDIFFRKRWEGDGKPEILHFDLSTRKTRELGIKAYDSGSLLLYKESFIPFPKRKKKKGKLHSEGRNNGSRFRILLE